MAYTTSDLITEAQLKIGDTSYSATELLNYANNTNRDIHTKHKLRYMQAAQNYTTATGVAQFGTLPADLLQAYNLRLTDASYAQKLPFLTFDEFDSRYPQPTLAANGVPYLWYTFAQLPYIFPAPSLPSGLSGYGLQLRYRKKPTDLTSSALTPDVPEEFREVVLLGMLRQAFERRSRYDISQLYAQQYEDRKLDLLDAYADGAFQDSDPYVIPTVASNG